MQCDNEAKMVNWTRRAFVLSATASVAAAKLRAKGRSGSANYVFIGSTAKGEGEGIHVASWDESTGAFSGLRLAFAASQPSFMYAVENHGQWLLFSGHQPSPTEAALSSFQVKPTGELEVVNTLTMPDEEESFIQIVVDRTHRCLVSASYRTSKVRSFKVAADGHLSGPVSEFQLTGSGPNPRRQRTAHAHGAVIAPGNNFALINDLGSDRIMVYKLNAATAEMTPNDPPYYAATPGSGPRHTAFHPNGKWAYCVSELNSTLTFFDWDGSRGVLTKVEVISTIPTGADVAKNRAGEVIIDRSGRFLYSCNRGLFEELLVYRIGPDGRLTLLQRTPLGGKEARHYAIDPSGKFLVVAEQFSDRAGIFARSPESGELQATGRTYPVDKASCIVFT
jgi:6-phosphogluconolactonase